MDERVDTNAGGTQDHLIVVGEFLLDRETIRVWRGDKPLRFSLRQFRLMELFMLHAGHPLSRKDIKEAIWGLRSTVDELTVDVQIGHLRRAIGGRRRETPIRTVRRQGYAFEIRQRRRTWAGVGGAEKRP
jgi:two-component system phosphate regulon response regulator PhoB